jgi:hypothetical protein
MTEIKRIADNTENLRYFLSKLDSKKNKKVMDVG